MYWSVVKFATTRTSSYACLEFRTFDLLRGIPFVIRYRLAAIHVDDESCMSKAQVCMACSDLAGYFFVIPSSVA